MQNDNRLIRLPDVMSKTGLGRASIYRYIDLGKFPAPVRVGERASAWVEQEIDAWISDRIKERANA
ncbi:MAG: AlpA family transcriptional regulator [Proteobacteria bacterium]|jgi:prophage regulatory protein|nr:AlpA family transcriptional regulator [Pseudomonadota bacterium]